MGGEDYIEWTHCDDMNNAIRWTRIPKQYSMFPQMVPTPPAAAGMRNIAYSPTNEFPVTVMPVWNYAAPVDPNNQSVSVEVQQNPNPTPDCINV